MFEKKVEKTYAQDAYKVVAIREKEQIANFIQSVQKVPSDSFNFLIIFKILKLLEQKLPGINLK